MWNLIHQFHYATSANLSLSEIIVLSVLAIIAWHMDEQKTKEKKDEEIKWWQKQLYFLKEKLW